MITPEDEELEMFYCGIEENLKNKTQNEIARNKQLINARRALGIVFHQDKKPPNGRTSDEAADRR